MSKTEQIITSMLDMANRGTTYSMEGSRIGTDRTADCSGAIYKGLIDSGCPKLAYPFSTESEHNYLLQNGYTLIAENQNWNAKRGDIFIWGKKGQSLGGAGHTGMFINADEIIHCNAYHNGVSTDNYNWFYNLDNRPYVYVYRPTNDTSTAPTPQPSKPATNNGKWIDENGTFTANQTLPFSKDIDPNSEAVAWIQSGQKVKYNAYCIANGYVWIRQPRTGGDYYMAVGQEKNGVNVAPFGSFQ